MKHRYNGNYESQHAQAFLFMKCYKSIFYQYPCFIVSFVHSSWLTPCSRVLERLIVAQVFIHMFCLLWDMEVSLLCSILSQMNLVHSLPLLFWRAILILSFHIGLRLPSSIFPNGLLTNILCAVLSVRAVCLTLLILPDLIILTISDEKCKLLIFSVCKFTQGSDTSFLLGLRILGTLDLCLSLGLETTFHTHMKTGEIVVLCNLCLKKEVCWQNILNRRMASILWI